MDEQAPRPRLEDWTAGAPAAGFVDRVMARVEQEARLGGQPDARPPLPASPARWRTRARLAAGAAAVAAVAAVATYLVVRPAARPAGHASVGSYLGSTARTTQQLGERAVAVAEAGATLSWQLDAAGAGSVSQQRGAVFYRVAHDPARRFSVQTPHGEVRVTGTCFTVEVAESFTRVLVHEGSVLVQGGEHSLALVAGERAQLGGGAVSRLEARATAEPRPASSAPGVGAVPTAAPTPATEGGPKINIDPATLREWAKRCYVRIDVPPFNKPDEPDWWDHYARSMGATQRETAEVREAYDELEQNALALLREIYTQATGDKVSESDDLDLDRMTYEIGRSAEFQEPLEALQRMSAERAGLQAPPPSEKMSPIERLLRGMAAQGDLFEAALAKRLGAARARQLRERNQGWPGPATEWEGCPKPAPAPAAR